MTYKNVTKFAPRVDQTPKKVWTANQVKELFHMFLSLPDPDDNWSANDEALNEEVMDGVESLVTSEGSRGAKRLLKDAGATREQIAQLFE